MIGSRICSEFDFDKSWFRRQSTRLRDSPAVDAGTRVALDTYNRKIWEWCYILAALEENGMLTPNKRGLGFGVGSEPLAAMFRDLGCNVLATDMPEDDPNVELWKPTNQWGTTAVPLDMRRIPPELHGQFDFIWSAGSFEHLGSLRASFKFWADMKKCLKPGGVAVHTTEFNLTSNDQTLEYGPVIVFRARDIELLQPENLSLTVTNGPHETKLPLPGEEFTVPHLRLRLGPFVITSIGLIARAQ